ncbi:MAG: hypothetical protein C0596_14485 [Marinilabiliales bacterium]|nr:MAG: hypothetical protein C0596_14485 [Marinilabiliales bacterium]
MHKTKPPIHVNKHLKIIQHICFWLTYFSLYIIYAHINYCTDYPVLIRDNLLYVAIDIIISYTIIKITYISLIKKNYFQLTAFSFISLAIGVLLYRLVYVYIIAYLINNYKVYDFWDFNIMHYSYSLFFPVALINIIHLIRKWVHSQREMYEIAKAKINHELSFLKIQLNQHFLFNTLNNIDSLIYSDPESASQTIVNLSNLLRYSIYETNVQRVPMKKEINYIATFIELYALRIIESDKIELKISGDFDNLYIVHRLFIPFVENALIYGKKDDDSKIYISITFVGNKVILHTMNQIKKMEYDKQGGVGINNIKRTLDLVYPEKYNLEMKNEDNWYTVKLSIELDDERNNDMYYSG